MMLNPWIIGLEAVQQGWQAQSALAFRLMRSFAGGVPDQTSIKSFDARTPLLTTSNLRKRRLPQLPMCERRRPQTSKRRLEQLPMCNVARPAMVLRVSKRTSRRETSPAVYQNAQPRRTRIPRQKRCVDRHANRDSRSFSGRNLIISPHHSPIALRHLTRDRARPGPRRSLQPCWRVGLEPPR